MFEPDREECSITFDHFDAADEIRRESLLALGNGLLSLRASAPEAAATFPRHDWRQEQYAGFYRAGWYDEAPRQVNGKEVRMAALVNLPDPFGLTLGIDGSWFNPACTGCCTYRQRLNMRDGVLERQLGLRIGEHLVELRESRVLSMADPRIALLRWEIVVPPGVPALELKSVLDCSVVNSLISRNRAYEGKRLQDIVAEHDEHGTVAVSARLHNPAHRLGMAVATSSPGTALHWTGVWEDNHLIQQARCPVPKGGSLVLEKRVVVQVNEELPADDRTARAKLCGALPRDPFFVLVQEHRKAWWALWARMPLRSTDKELQRILHFHAYHLVQTISPHSCGHDLGFPSRGWHEGYYGHIFWDQILAFPFLSTHFPELARELLDYRYRRLDIARERARRLGLRGAMFPWRSARSGEEETPPFQCNPISGRWMTDDTRLQRHVGAAIAYDVWQLYLSTGDEELLAGFGGEMILEIARFWGSIAQLSEDRGRYVICGVIGPDEYHNRYPDADEPGLDNNAYTNVMAVWTLDCAERLMDAIGADRARLLCDKLQIDQSELQRWRDIRSRMYLPFREDGVLSEFEGFDDLQEPPTQWLTDSRPRLDWMLEAQGDSSERYQLTKQADVLMLLHLFPVQDLRALLANLGYDIHAEQLEKTVTYHMEHITNESSLSRAVCAGALAAFDTDASWRYFRQTLHVDLEAKSDRGVREGVHLGAMSGSLDTLQRHYLGIRPTRDGLAVFPSVPRQLPDVELGLTYRGALIAARLIDGKLNIESERSNNTVVVITHSEGRVSLSPGDSLVLDPGEIKLATGEEKSS